MALTKIPGHLLDKSAHIDFADNEQLRFGNSNDVILFHNSSNNYFYISNNNTAGGILIQNNASAGGIALQPVINENAVYCAPNGAVQIYHDGSSKLQTTATGINVTGSVVADGVSIDDDQNLALGSSDEFKLYHTSSGNSIISETGGGSLYLDGSNIYLRKSTGSGEAMADFVADGAVTLYHDNSPRVSTSTAGATVTGTLTVTGDLDITGNVNSTSVTDLDVTDKTITVGAGQTESNSGGSGLIVDGSNASILWDETSDEWDFNKSVSIVDTGGANLFLNDSNGRTIRLRSANSGSQNSNISSYAGLYLGGSDNANHMLINGSGNVKIGSSSTSGARLSVTGTSSGSNNPGIFQIGTDTTMGTGTNMMTMGVDNDSHVWIQGTKPGHDARHIVLQPGGLVNANAYVGIGVTDPSAALHIQTATSDTNSAVLSLMITNLSSGTTTTGFGGEIRFQAQRNNGVNQNTGGIRSVAEVNAGTNISSGLAFDVGTAGITDEALRIKYNGNVGIGTNDPTHKLTVYNANGAGALFRRSGSAGPVMQFQAGAAAAGNIAVQSTGLGFGGGTTENKLFIDTAGNVGFGTSSPLRSFDSRHALNIFGSGGYTELMLRGRAGTAQNLGAFHWSIRGDVGGNNDDLMLLRFTGGNSPAYAGTSMHIRNDNGYVGIGTNTGQPSSPLHIKSDNEFQLKIEASSAAGASQQLYTAGGYAYTVYQNASATWRTGAYGGSNFVIRNHGTGTDEFTINSSGEITAQTAAQSETGIAQLTLQNNVNANPSHVNIKFNTYAWLGMIQCEQRAAGQYGALNFWTGNNGNPTQKMCLNYAGNLCLANAANQDGVNPKHRVITVTGSTTVTANSWSVSPGSNGGYDVSNDDSSEFSYNGAYTGAGYYNRHIAKFCLVGNYTADTWYPIVASTQLFDWVSSGSPGANPWDGFSMYFRIYTYDISAGGSEYLSHRLTDRIWVNGYTCNSNQRHHIAIGAGWGHAPNGGQSNDHQDYASNPYQMCVNHHYNTDAYYPAKQTVEFKFKTARTGLTETHSAQSVYVYAYVG